MKFWDRSASLLVVPVLPCIAVAVANGKKHLRQENKLGSSPFCGDGICETTQESCRSCSADCGICRELQDNRDNFVNAKAVNAKIRTQDFCNMWGVGLEDTSDVGGGQNVGWIDTNDWVAFVLTVPATGLYNVSYRIASPDGNGSFELEFYRGLGVIGSITSLPQTGGWQNWQTVSHTVTLTEGENALAVKATMYGWNLNWVKFTPSGGQPTGGPSSAPVIALPPVPPPVAAPVAAPNAIPDPIPPPVPPFEYEGFLRVQGKIIVDGKGQNVILRGMGFGGWMLQEPYMMLTGGIHTGGQHEMFADVKDLVGAANFEIYREAWLDNYCSQTDVIELRNSGFNSLRVPLHYNLFTLPIEEEPIPGQDTWLPDGFARLDLLLEWCKNAGIYLILDLHAAPGGQGKDANINDYDVTKPSLWEDSENVRKTIALWVKFAERYRDETMIGGYDLINEPNRAFTAGGHPNGCTDTVNGPLKAFYDAAVPAIRAVDLNHFIVIEGNCWSNNHNGLWPIADDNLVLSLHRYWIANTLDSIQQFLDLRDQYNVPLWMGESGENSDQWYSDAVALLESNNIGWAWWPWKKIESESGSFSISKPDGYQTLLNYWEYGGTKPGADFSFEVMMQLAENALLENTERNNAVIDALTGHVRCDVEVPISLDAFETVKIEAEDYCSMFGIHVESCTDTGGGSDIGWIDTGDWVAFKIQIPLAGEYDVKYRVASKSGGGGLRLEYLSGGIVLGTISPLPTTGGWQAWDTVSHTVELAQGEHMVAVKATGPGWNLNWLEFSRSI